MMYIVLTVNKRLFGFTWLSVSSASQPVCSGKSEIQYASGKAPKVV